MTLPAHALTPGARVRLTAPERLAQPELADRTGTIEADLGDGVVEVVWGSGGLVSWIGVGMLEEVE